jgi:CHAD domain-containing protein
MKTGVSRSYRLLDGEPVPEGLRRIARGRIDHAVDELRGKSDSTPEKAVHEARKDMKKLRALLRLARRDLKKDVRVRENAAFRDVARELAGARDAEVMGKTLESLGMGTQPGLKKALAAHRKELAKGGMAGRKRTAVAALRLAGERVDEWPLERDGFGALRRGLERTYGRGRDDFKAARKDPTAESLHEWRKRVKDLWYAHTILEGAWPGVMEATGDEVHALSERLGDDHDLAVLLDFAREHGGADGVAAAVEERRAGLQAEAFDLGRRVYAEPTKAFVARVESYWDAWRPAT